MALYTKECLETLRSRVDLVDLLSSHIELKPAGATYKALCPFHDEKSPSFVVQRGASHYHCFGCQAHGDAIAFLMNFLNLSFQEAVQSLAERFNVPLEFSEGEQTKGPSAAKLKEALELAANFYHTCLLSTEAGKPALHYLLSRGISLDFIRRFKLGFAPDVAGAFEQVMRERKVPEAILIAAGLLKESKRPFFFDRITFPICNAMGSVIGFSARKIKESTFGGKYINTSETPLFKKSRVLFGLNYSRRRIIKEKEVILVEGQLDCLQMIDAGFDLTIAALGTAFGKGHIEQLRQLGVQKATLLFDGDDAGKKAASKAGDLLQAAGIEVIVVTLPGGVDPDTFLCERGPQKLREEMQKGQDYLTFQVALLSQEHDPNTPAGKNQLVELLTTQIDAWEMPVMVHESLKKLARLVQLPEQMVGAKPTYATKQFLRRESHLPLSDPDPNRILEMDLLRWLILCGEKEPLFFQLCETYLDADHFWVPELGILYTALLTTEGPKDLLSLATHIEDEETQNALDEIMKKKINIDRAKENFAHTLQKLLDRQWMQQREEIRQKIHTGGQTDEQIMELAASFDALSKQRIHVKCDT